MDVESFAFLACLVLEISTSFQQLADSEHAMCFAVVIRNFLVTCCSFGLTPNIPTGDCVICMLLAPTALDPSFAPGSGPAGPIQPHPPLNINDLRVNLVCASAL